MVYSFKLTVNSNSIMEVLFYLGCICGAILVGFLIGMFFTYWLINEDDE